MTRNTIMKTRNPAAMVSTAALCALLVAGLTGCGLRGRDNTPPTVPPQQPTTAPVQPTQAGQPAQPTVAQPTDAAVQPTAEQPTAVPPTVAAPTQAPTVAAAQPDTQGDEIEQLLDQLDQQNQKADPLNDVPQ